MGLEPHIFYRPSLPTDDERAEQRKREEEHVKNYRPHVPSPEELAQKAEAEKQKAEAEKQWQRDKPVFVTGAARFAKSKERQPPW